MIESICRIAIITFVILIWLSFGIRFAVAHDDDDDKPKPKPPAVSAPVASSPSNNRKSENLLGGMLFSGVATAAMRDQPNGAAWAFAATVVGAAAIETGHSNSKMSNVWWAVGGASAGTIGTCRLLLSKNFVGCAFAF